MGFLMTDAGSISLRLVVKPPLQMAKKVVVAKKGD